MQGLVAEQGICSGRPGNLPEPRKICGASGAARTGLPMSRDSLGDVEKHFWLTRSVARCMDISLTEAMAEGRLSANEYSRIVTRCRAANCSGQCEVWLSQQQAQAASAPEFCANADRLNALKA
ncbi:DUF6455 family protein [Ruegeria arenilitoris]|uniref:DUF6455 family protein n=1 Tax=Ruegeria arenilitoris TaxID=1173585 RepID=UPI0034638D50